VETAKSADATTAVASSPAGAEKGQSKIKPTMASQPIFAAMVDALRTNYSL